MKVSDIRGCFVDFFKAHSHVHLPSSPLVPSSDPTLMFTNAGMVQFKDYFTGARVPEHRQVVTSQKCIRAGGKHNDLENVGYTARHHTFFEMLGNFSFGGYFKEDAISMAWQLLTKELALDAKRLYITVYHTDEEAFRIWKKITGFADEKIIRITTDDNFWSMGDIGPCGPCSEVFYDHGEHIFGGLPGTKNEDGDRYIEIWNLVFMQYERLADGRQIDLPSPCIDTGMGLERISSVLQSKSSNYEIDLFQSIIKSIKDITKIDEARFNNSYQVISDHIRSCCFLIADGVMPSNEGRGYVLRRILRRAMRHINAIGCKEPLMSNLSDTLISLMSGTFGELSRADAIIKSTLLAEEESFAKTLDRGMKILDKESSSLQSGGMLSGDVAFKLYDTYGFPVDLVLDVMRPKNITVDIKSFYLQMALQKERARAAWSGSGQSKDSQIWFELYQEFGATEFIGYLQSRCISKVLAIVATDGTKQDSASLGKSVIVMVNQSVFYGESGGQVGDIGLIEGVGEIYDTKKYCDGLIIAHFVKITKKEIKVHDAITLQIDERYRNLLKANHSATHLLHKALRVVLGDHVTQKGSIVESEKLRFDFSHNTKMTKQQISQVQHIVSEMIAGRFVAKTEILDTEDAINAGAMALFGEKYDSTVRVVSIGDSVELCGGTHVFNSSDIGVFKIISEESIASGVRRIVAKTGSSAINYMESEIKELQDTNAQILEKCKKHERDALLLKNENILFKATLSVYQDISQDNLKLRIYKIYDRACDIKTVSDLIRSKFGQDIAILFFDLDGLVSILAMVPKSCNSVSASDLIKEITSMVGGKGGGNRQMARAGGAKKDNIEKSISHILNVLQYNGAGVASFKSPDSKIWLDGKIARIADSKISIMSHSLHYGSAVFEGMRCYGGKIFKANEHFERFIKSAQTIFLDVSYTKAELIDATEQIIAANGLQDAYIRPIAYKDDGATGISGKGCKSRVAIIGWKSDVKKNREKGSRGIKICISDIVKYSQSGIPFASKVSGLYVVSSIAKQRAAERGFEDALLLDEQNNITECTVANIFFIDKSGVLITPKPQNYFLNGITRQEIISIAKQMGIKTVERDIGLEEISNMSAAFLTGTSVEITPVASITTDDKNVVSYDVHSDILQNIKSKYIEIIS